MLIATFDDALGIVRSTSAGYSQQSEVEAYIDALAALAVRARARRGAFLHFVDASDATALTREALESFENSRDRLVRLGDRTAVVLRSALVKMQSNRAMPKNQSEVFDSEAKALAWLLAADDDSQTKPERVAAPVR